MDDNRQKWVNLAYVISAALLGYVVFEVFTTIAATYDLEARFQNIDLIIRAVSIGSAAILFIGLYRSDRTNQFMHEVVAELSRVTWPTQRDTINSTIVVLIMVMISGLFLGGMDALWTWMLRFIL